MADTTNATYDGGIDVPHECLSGANINIIPETSKQFPKFNIKQMDAGLKTCVHYVLSYYKNYVSKLSYSTIDHIPPLLA
jgi:histidinol phosphatase-like PHP family hydrolase